jgi:hypothetical protein
MKKGSLGDNPGLLAVKFSQLRINSAPILIIFAAL